MGDVYRVQIVRESGSGESYESETIFEVAGGIGLVMKLAPGALVDALREACEDVPAPLAEQVMDAAAAAGAPVVPNSHPFQGAEPAKRKRRTKAEIAADEAAVAAGYRDAAHQAEVVAQQAGQPTVETIPVPAAEAAPAATVPAEAPQPAAPVAVTTTFESASPAAAPFNPFEVK